MTAQDKADVCAGTFLLVVFVAGSIGWCLNIWKLAGMGSDQLGYVVVRVLGIVFAPLGAVIGWF